MDDELPQLAVEMTGADVRSPKESCNPMKGGWNLEKVGVPSFGRGEAGMHVRCTW
jgi:hypothetical protein